MNSPFDPGQGSGQLRPAALPDPDQDTGQLRLAASQVTMYTTSWCGYCVRLKRHLKDAGIVFDEVNIETDPAAAELVQQANGGNHTVPTLVFADGTALTNPTIEEVKSQLAA